MFSHREWSKKKYAEDPEYREKRRASDRTYKQSHKKELADRRRLKMQTDPEYRERKRASDRLSRRKTRFKTVYGITMDDYDAMLARQGGVCKICRRKPEPEKVLSVDHCHARNKVRELLCSGCNSMLGFS